MMKRILAPICACSLFAWSACSNSHVIAEHNDSDDTTGTGGGQNDDPAAGGRLGQGGAVPPLEPTDVCEPTAESESECSDGVDDDCDGFVDCRDSDCEAQICGDADGYSCTAGACLAEGSGGLPELPSIQNVAVQMLGSTAIVTFEPVENALDYRIYPLPAPEDVLVGEDGEVVVRDAIYRCGGDRPMVKREDDPAGHFDASLTAAANIYGYLREDGSELLGYVYLTPGADRKAVYRVADPMGKGGYAWDYLVPPDMHYNAADYVVGAETRDALLASGYRDDGIAFYAPDDGDVGVQRLHYEPGNSGGTPTFFFVGGPESEARADDDGVTDVTERFKIYADEQPDTVPLYRVFYLADNPHDTLAAGEPRFERALYQGNQPIWSLTWPGLTEDTTLVVEALDEGCPFPGGYISAESAPGDPDTDGHYPSFTLDEARIESGEVFINAQHNPDNRPRPLARAYVEVSPESDPDMDWYENFDDSSTFAELPLLVQANNGVYIKRNDEWSAEFSGCSEGISVGPLLGQLTFGGGDYGSSCNMSIIPQGVNASLTSDSFLHVRMTTEIPSTRRRYPQLLITTAPVNEITEGGTDSIPLRNNLGPMPFEETYQAGSGSEHTLILQPFSPGHEMQIQFCDRRGWGVSAQCPRANIYGYHAGDYEAEWTQPWLPLPVLGEIAGHDRPVRFDLYASTQRVYVYVDNEPAGCAVMPEETMPAGPVTIVFGSVAYHTAIDESVLPDDSPHQYLKNYSLVHYDRRIDEMGVDNDVTLPGWDESRLPCGDIWYGAPQ